MSGYVPRDGSVAQRVIWHLEQHGKCSGKRIAEEVDDVAASGLPANLATAIRLGAIFVRKIDGENWYDVKPFTADEESDTPQGGIKAKSSERQAVQGPVAEAGNGTPPAPPPPATRELPPSPGIRDREGGEALPSAAPSYAVALPDIPVFVPSARVAPAPYTGIETFACAVYSDGRLLLEIIGEPLPVLLSASEVRQLRSFLNRALP